MKTYVTNGDSKLEVEISELQEADAKVKVRITHILPSMSDVNIFSGDSSTTYPFVIGHGAIGVISDDRPEYGLKRGEKVIINPYTTEGIDRFNWDVAVTTKGVDEDGFMRELAYVEKEKLIPFPEEGGMVSETEAIFTERIALALKVLNSFSMEKGDYIVIIGGDTVCNLIGQLALYFQLIPIMIDSNADNLARAQKAGIYYTIDETKESAYEKVSEITCGKMAENTVISMGGGLTPAFMFPMTKVGGKCIILCENKAVKSFEADVSVISRRQLRVRGVNNGATEFDSAINILAQKILNFDGFIDKTVEAKDAAILLREMKQNPERYFNAVIKL